MPLTYAETQSILAALRGDMQRMIATEARKQTGIIAGTYTNPTVTFDQHGHALYAANGVGGGATPIGVWAYVEGPLDAPEANTAVELLVDPAEKDGVYDTSTFWDSGQPTRITYPQDGVYLASYSLDFEVSSIGTFRQAYLYVLYGGENVAIGELKVPPVINVSLDDDTRLAGSGIVNVETGDYMELRVAHDAGGDLPIYRAQVKAQYLGPRITPLT